MYAPRIPPNTVMRKKTSTGNELMAISVASDDRAPCTNEPDNSGAIRKCAQRETCCTDPCGPESLPVRHAVSRHDLQPHPDPADHEPEGDECDSGAHPGEHGALVCLEETRVDRRSWFVVHDPSSLTDRF